MVSKDKIKKKVPVGIILISIISFIASVLLFFSSIGFFLAGSMILNDNGEILNQTLEQIKNNPSTQPINITEEKLKEQMSEFYFVFPIFGAIFLAVSILYLISGVSILFRKKWGRYIQIIISMFLVIISVAFLSSPLLVFFALCLIINAGILGYLLFNKKVTEYFYN